MKVINFFRRNLWLTLILFSLIPIILDIFYPFISISQNCCLLDISVSLLGFLITALSIMLALSDQNKFIVLIKRYKKDKELYSLIIATIIFLLLTTMLSFVQINPILIQITTYFFITAIFELIGVIYYLLRIYLGYDKYKNNN